MIDMKCPVCNSYLHKIPVKEAWVCSIHDSKEDLYGSKELWQELIRTRKALEIAVDALKSAHDYYEYCIQRDKDYGSDDINWDCTAMNMDNDISDALEQITALEQKDNGGNK